MDPRSLSSETSVFSGKPDLEDPIALVAQELLKN
jgi:hypothetical protein